MISLRAPPSSYASISSPVASSRAGGVERSSPFSTRKPFRGRLKSAASAASFHNGRAMWNKSPARIPLSCSQRGGALSRLICLCAGGSDERDGGEGSENTGSVIRDAVVRAGELLSMGFPLWVSAACVLALWRPSAFDFVQPKWQIIGITLTMLGMGITLTLDDLKGALLMPKELLIGFLLQYTVMPFSGYMVGKALKLPSYYAAGLILVSCCPGGTASNIVTYLARYGKCRSLVLMTAASTFASVVMTPFLTSKLAGSTWPSTQPASSSPHAGGALLNQYCGSLVGFISPVMPFIAVATVAVLCGSAIAQNAAFILASGCTWWSPSPASTPRDSSSGTFYRGCCELVLGVVLAGRHLGSPLAAVPCAVSSVCHSVYGSALAGVWRSRPAE
ncbi:unnamed protein product [Spirodela intermedia]|uniref:Uncharacterized protein n=1 Tax=Spirodela intermedia TaxID=51605 RepID=A0A7I8IQF7_SPIIN|nr:unnamed protein product [Spirodela intermedia]CAA6659815.1 unnamed protein product [Spirodela intermedia]